MKRGLNKKHIKKIPSGQSIRLLCYFVEPEQVPDDIFADPRAAIPRDYWNGLMQ
jgi:hypothetical protein